MKKIILTIAGVMMIGLIIAIILHQNFTQLTPPFANPAFDNQAAEAQENREPEQEQLQPIYVNSDRIAYSLQNEELNITFDGGENWTTVPVEKDLLFEGEYNGNKQELIEHSFVLTDERAAFLDSDGLDWDNKQIRLIYSIDNGETWQESVVEERYTVMRFRKVDFLNENFGYVIISGGRTMSQEGSNVYVTHDGGENWEATNHPGVTSLISDGGFVDETTGFLSFGTINPIMPIFYVTQDGGNTWSEATINIPPEFDGIFVTAEIPFKEEDHLAVFISQGPDGDYEGGNVKGKFISHDNGLTWEFLENWHSPSL